MQTQNSLFNFNDGDPVETPHPNDFNNPQKNRFYPAASILCAPGKINDNNLVPPLPQKLELQEEKPPETMAKTRNIRFKIKYGRKLPQEPRFKIGGIVEVCSGDKGYEGAWFIASIVDLIGKDRYLVEYKDLITDDVTELLKEEIDESFIRPCPPEITSVGSFQQFQEVDAWYNDGWWEGVVLEVVNSRECFVAFINRDVLSFENSKLRPHQDWLEGKWVISSKKSSELVKKFGDVISRANNLTGKKLNLTDYKFRELAHKARDVASKAKNIRIKFVSHFGKGAKVEVKSDAPGYEGAWYTAIVIDYLQNGKYLVEYLTLQTEDLTEQLREEANASDIRPSPPDIYHSHRFALHERVDAWYNDGWWEGQVSCVLSDFKYRVYFWHTKENLEFKHGHLRPTQKWVDGRWVHPSMVQKHHQSYIT